MLYKLYQTALTIYRQYKCKHGLWYINFIFNNSVHCSKCWKVLELNQVPEGEPCRLETQAEFIQRLVKHGCTEEQAEETYRLIT